MNEGVTSKHALWVLSPSILVVVVLLIALWVVPPAPIGHTTPVVPQMPTQIDVNGVQWRIQIVPTLGSLVGNTDCGRRVIYISALSIDKHTVVMHELSHAVVCMGADMRFISNNLWFNSTNMEEHEGIYHFAELWSELLERNPALAAYLGSKE
jgi:hypothetical protein